MTSRSMTGKTTGSRAAMTTLVVSGTLALLTTSATAVPARARGAGPLRDLQPLTSQPTDGATAQVTARESAGSTTVEIKVQGLDHRAAGTTLGAHVHVGECVAGNGAAAGPHYNASAVVPPVVNALTEVWLDFTIRPNGTARASATVPFTIDAGAAGSVVIHADPTSTGPTPPSGAAGPRLACLPVQF